MKKKELDINKEEITKEIINDVKNELEKNKQQLKDDIIKEIRLEANTIIKDDIKESIILDVNNEIKDNIRREQKNIIRSKNFKIFKKNIFILLLIGIIVYFGYCLWDAKYFWFLKDKKEEIKNEVKEEINEEKEEIIIKGKNWYVTNYSYLLDNMKLDLSYDNPNIYYLYTGNYNKSNIKDTIKLNIAYKFIENKNETDYNYTIYEDDMKNAYIKVFGNLDNYIPTSFTVGCMQFYYNNVEGIYTAYKFICDSNNSLQIKEEIKDIYEDNGKIIIETVMGVFDKNDKYLFNYSNLYISLTNDFDETKSVLEYEDRLNTYKYKFSNIDNNYYFESIEKIK